MLPLVSSCIRILHLEAANTAAPIRVRLSQVSLESQPAYDAPSYCWRSDVKEFAITCDGRPQDIARNLFQALPYLRFPDRERLLWIDALCIDQDNLQERQQQEGKMNEVYRRASQVLSSGLARSLKTIEWVSLC